MPESEKWRIPDTLANQLTEENLKFVLGQSDKKLDDTIKVADLITMYIPLMLTHHSFIC
jgi:hypothetical protein